MKEKKLHIAIIGAGFGGLAAAIQLQKAGYQNFLIFEKAAEVGGTWRDNTYPGCGCDVPSHLYSFSFHQNPNWSRQYSKQPEIFQYLKDTVEMFDLKEKIQFQTEISDLIFDEKTGVWHLKTKTGENFSAQIIISATGPLNNPNIPKIKGLESFQGKQFHSSTWDKNYNLTGKKVATIGTGASAIQFIPEIAPKVSQLTVFQRTPPWVLPKPDRSISSFEHLLFRIFPFLQRLQRNLIYWLQESTAAGFLGNFKILSAAEWCAKWYLKRKVKDPVLRKKLTPTYRLGCKRIILSRNYYPALVRENVEVNTNGISEIKAHSILDKTGREISVDALIFGTGFQASEEMVRMRIVGKKRQNLTEGWATNGAQSYFGINVSGFPNLFFLLGPNTGLGHNSAIYVIESQVNYVLDYLKKLEDTGATYFDIKKEVQIAFQEEIQEKLKGTVWQSGGCTSWYQTKEGFNTTIYPGGTYEYRRRTRKVNLGDFAENGDVNPA